MARLPTRSWTRAILGLFLALFLNLLANAQLAQSSTVLLLEDQTSAPATDSIERELQQDIESQSKNSIEFYRESLDTILISDKKYQSDTRQWFKRKYANRNIDVIVAIGPEASAFLRSEHEISFPGIPIVLCGDQKTEGEDATLGTGLTGVWIDLDPVSTLNVARQLLPATKHVAVVSGDGVLDKMMYEAVRTKLRDYRDLDVFYLTGFDLSSLLEKFHTLPKDTVVLYLTVTEDRSGRHFFARDTLALVSATVNVPVFGLIDLLVGRGMVGGRVTSPKEEGALASKIVTRILQGEKPGKIPPVIVANRYLFDSKQLQRWGLDASRLPRGSVVINQAPSALVEYQRSIITVVVVILLQTGLLAYLLVEYTRRRKAQRALEHDIYEREKAEAALIDLSRRLITAQEEERSRIAQELHDDFAQRMAMLTVILERTAQLVLTQPEEAIDRMREIWNQTSEIGADLHELSHKLHSSVLETLGLCEGIRVLCAEFTDQRKVQTEFTDHNVPRAISPATSLCLFRIAQEGLTNVVKHSGTKSASVELAGNDNEIRLSIVDRGVGFSRGSHGFHPGLGLRGMEERVRTVGGTVEIKSSPGGGTQILVRVPLGEMHEG